MGKKSLKGELEIAQEEGAFDPAERDKVLKRVALRFFGALLIMMIVFVIVLALYFGAMWDPSTRKLDILIVNKDQGLSFGGQNLSLGDMVTDFLLSKKVLDFKEDSDPLSRGPDFGRHRVVEYKDWGVLTIPENYTVSYVQALFQDLGEYENPIRFDYNQGRQKTTADAAKNIVSALIAGISKELAIRTVSGEVLPYNCSDVTAAAVVDPIYLLIVVSFPVIANGYNFITYMGVNILWTVAASLLNISMTVTHPLFKQFSLTAVHVIRTVCILICCFFQSLFFMSIVAAYADVDQFAHSFGAIWMYLFFVLITFQTLLNFLIRMLGVAGLLLLSPILVLQITTSNAIIHTDMMPGFYGTLGVGLPFYHAIEGLRFMVIGQTDSRIGTNIGVLLAYFVGFYLLNALLWHIKVKKFIKQYQSDTVVDAGTSAALAFPSDHGKGFAGASF
mmetsp:Transcript_30044/g.41510  ORF Transcript_30044/g.41510 Transcript_30044/m.41510 type:complete len:447 (-) Transcript_30044:229-1569(-)|eukprot:CAMPEP_0201475356 /NCGR_PEP_ID=MMETSP0151_2-20130828/778_1 /ASSEMBLY_ACC=CAM_ASM_000257 /TAXON_ID=200890 /ORGANISM="Paramoeba atlantica, Strain 621/1 / CCAP 1560/9" /LENGTH=446 /DNA_ID=CAMNT_0047855415 /DNA_START=50 /DNA_END=1390 /DNA_ORIENTATION=+